MGGVGTASCRSHDKDTRSKVLVFYTLFTQCFFLEVVGKVGAGVLVRIREACREGVAVNQTG